MVNCYTIRDPDFWTEKVLLPHSPQQLAEAKECCITILPQIRSKYAKRNPSKSNSDVDNDEDNNMDSIDRELYNDPFQNPDYQEDYNLTNVVKFCKGLHTCLPVTLGFQLVGQELNRCVCPLSKMLVSWRKAYTMFSDNWTVYK